MLQPMSPTARNPPLRGAAIAALLALATAAAYARVFWLGFAFDDRSFILGNARVLSGLSAGNVLWAFTSTYHANWQPLTWISCMLDVELFGPGPRGFHAVNLALHLGNVALLFLALRLISGAFWRPALVAALFALHPLNVETVAWITERSALLGTGLGLLAVIAHVRHARAPSAGRLAAVAALLALSLLAKPLLVTLPLLLLLLDFWPLGRLRGDGPLRRRAGRLLLEKLPLLALSAASSLATLYAQRAWGAILDLVQIPLPLRLGNALLSYVRYLGQAFWPSGLAAFYPFPLTLHPLRVLAAAALLAAVSVAAVAWWKRRPWLVAGWLWYLGALVPMIGIVQAGGQARADRYAYLPLLGIFIAVAWSLAVLDRAPAGRRGALLAASAAALCALSVATSLQTSYWKDELTLFRHALQVTEDNALAQFNVGVELLDRGDRDGARRHFAEAVRIRPDYAEARGNLGNALVGDGEVEAGISQFREALRLKPGLAEVRVNLGAALVRLGRRAQAETEYREALRQKPDLATAHMNLANLLSDARRTEEALAHYRTALALAPRDPQIHFNLGITLAAEGRHAEAAAAFRETLRLQPGHAPALQNLRRLPGGAR